jgi:hypothetical protein
MAAVAKDLPTTLPVDSLDYIIDVLGGQTTLDRNKGITAVYNVLGYLLGKVFSTVSVASVAIKPKKLSKKQIVVQLKGLKGEGVKAEAVPAWLIPILLDLAQKWLQKKAGI